MAPATIAGTNKKTATGFVGMILLCDESYAIWL